MVSGVFWIVALVAHCDDCVQSRAQKGRSPLARRPFGWIVLDLLNLARGTTVCEAWGGGIPNDKWGKAVVPFVAVRAGEQADDVGLIGFAKKCLRAAKRRSRRTLSARF